MSDLDYATAEDQTLPGVTYGLYLLGLTHGLTIIIAVIIAYAARGNAGPVMRSHYNWIIRTFWLSIFWSLAWGLVAAMGALLSVILIGLPFLWLAVCMLGLVWVWTLVRLIVGVVHLSRGDAVPRPYSWIV